MPDLLGRARDRDWSRKLPHPDLRVAPGRDHMAEGTLVLARVIDRAPPGARGWHPFGMADASEFAAMACDELLVHTDDAARGLDLPFAPPAELARATLERLFPWAPGRHRSLAGPPLGNGRIDLPGHGNEPGRDLRERSGVSLQGW